MEIIKTLCWVVQIISAFVVIVFVLLQQGKGAEAGATFGASGASGSIFGASGSANFLSRMTAIFATVFFITTFGLVLLANYGQNSALGVMSNYKNALKPSTALPAVTQAAQVRQPVTLQSTKATTLLPKTNEMPQDK